MEVITLKSNRCIDQQVIHFLDRHPENPRRFLLALVNDDQGMSLLESLRHTICRMGIRRFSGVNGIEYERVRDFVESRSEASIEEIELFLAPFGLKCRLELELA